MPRSPAILLIDAQSRYRADLRGLLEARIARCEVAVASTTSEIDGSGQIDVILVDEESVSELSTPMLKDMRSRNPRLRVAVLSRSTSPADVLSILSAGFDGVIYKFLSDECIVAAVLDLLSPRLSIASRHVSRE
jgi:DNA-binding NarL/FixJ family response regulator